MIVKEPLAVVVEDLAGKIVKLVGLRHVIRLLVTRGTPQKSWSG